MPFSPLPNTPIPPSISFAPDAALRPRRRRRRWLIGLLLLLLLGSALGTFFWFTTRASVPGANQVGGYAVFVSSGELREGNSQGINDELRITLYNVSDPNPGKSYYAWLLGDRLKGTNTTACQAQQAMVFLGKLEVQQGAINYLYPGDHTYTNLLQCSSRLLITEESTGSTPTHYSQDKSTWRYYAELPQQLERVDRSNALDYLRNLLYDGSTIKQQGVHGGLNVRLLRNMQKVWEWVSSARDSNDPRFIRRQVIRALDYIDGLTNVHQDMPAGTPLLVEALLIKYPLLNITHLKLLGDGASYPGRMYKQLNFLLSAPGITPDMRTLAVQVNLALQKDIQPALVNLHKDALQLFALTDAQLLAPTTLPLLDDMQVQANNAFFGQLDPTTNLVQPGVVQIYYDIQRLATFHVTPCPCPVA